MPRVSLALLTYEKLVRNKRLTYAESYILRTLTYAKLTRSVPLAYVKHIKTQNFVTTLSYDNVYQRTVAWS